MTRLVRGGSCCLPCLNHVVVGMTVAEFSTLAANPAKIWLVWEHRIASSPVLSTAVMLCSQIGGFLLRSE